MEFGKVVMSSCMGLMFTGAFVLFGRAINAWVHKRTGIHNTYFSDETYTYSEGNIYAGIALVLAIGASIIYILATGRTH